MSNIWSYISVSIKLSVTIASLKMLLPREKREEEDLWPFRDLVGFSI